MKSQQIVDQASAQTAQIFDGAKLSTAFKTDSGKVIFEALVQGIVTHLDDILHENLGDEECLKRLYEIKGILGVVDGMGDSIKAAIRAVSRNAVSAKLRGRTALQQEE